jgi:phage terminase large subunit-like protein
MRPREWLPNPPAGTSVCGGLDGSENNDWTAIRLETREGFQFTPRWPGTDRPMVWNPAQHGGRIPRIEVHEAWAVLSDVYRFERVYADPGFNNPNDPTSWITEIETWAGIYGEKTFIAWQMNGSLRTSAVYAALIRFETDLRSGALTHDGCPITAAHIANARKIPKQHDKFILGKPSGTQKIDAAVTSVLAHEAASDARAAGWDPEPADRRVFVFRR